MDVYFSHHETINVFSVSNIMCGLVGQWLDKALCSDIHKAGKMTSLKEDESKLELTE